MEWSAEDRRQIYVRGLAIRAVAASAFLLFFSAVWLAGLRGQMPGLPYLVVVLAALIAINPFMWAVGQRREFKLGDFRWHWAIDLLAVTTIIYYLGLLDIPLAVSAYMIMIVSSATFASESTSLWLAHWSSLALVGLVALEESELVAHQHVAFTADPTIEGKIVMTGGSIVLFYIFGYLASTVAGQLRGKAEEVEMQKRVVENAYVKEQMARDRMVLLSTLVQHDIYSPLGAISGACQLAIRSCEDGDPSGVTRFVQMIDGRLRSIEAAVATLGVFGDENEPGNFVLRDTIDELIEDVAAESQSRHVAINVVGNWPTVTLPREEVYHVLRNLVMNSIRAVDDDGSGRVTVRAISNDLGGECRIEVVDNGYGVSGDLTSILTQPALRRLGARKPGGGFGAGLGLSSNVVRGWGGKVEYHANPEGKGSVFSIVLPQHVFRQAG